MEINNKVAEQIAKKFNIPKKEVELILQAVAKHLTVTIKEYDLKPFRIHFLGKFMAKPYRIYAINNRKEEKIQRIKNIQKYRPVIKETEDGYIISYRKNNIKIKKDEEIN